MQVKDCGSKDLKNPKHFKLHLLLSFFVNFGICFKEGKKPYRMEMYLLGCVFIWAAGTETFCLLILSPDVCNTRAGCAHDPGVLCGWWGPEPRACTCCFPSCTSAGGWNVKQRECDIPAWDVGDWDGPSAPPSRWPPSSKDTGLFLIKHKQRENQSLPPSCQSRIWWPLHSYSSKYCTLCPCCLEMFGIGFALAARG